MRAAVVTISTSKAAGGLRAQFANLEVVLSSLKQQSSQLSQSINGLSGSSSG